MYTATQIIEKYNLENTKRRDAKSFIPFCARRGIIIQHIKKEGRSNYYAIIEENIELPNEKWSTCKDLPEYEISNMGRIRKNKIYYNLSTNNQGYKIFTSNDKKHYKVHRLVLNTFKPVPNSEELIVDHINGIKADNRLENLQWKTQEENTKLSFLNRKPFDVELTRLITKYGYEKALELIKSLK